MTVYPQTFPCPDRQPYSLAVDAGVLRTQFSAGNFRQRRIYRRMPTLLSLQFTMRADELTAWQEWCNANAWNWFQIDLESALGKGQILAPHEIRFITSLDINSEGWNLVSVTVAAEMSPAMLAGAFVPVLPGPPIMTVPPFSNNVAIGTPFTLQPTVIGGRFPLIWSAKLPAGWSINAATGAISSPALPQGDYPFQITVTDADGNFDKSKPFILRVVQSDGWIVGNTPPSPSTDFVIGGMPAAPSQFVTVPGTPSIPSVIV
jgi:Putative Ig domain